MLRCLPLVILDSPLKVAQPSQIKSWHFGKQATTRQVQIIRSHLMRPSRNSEKAQRQKETTPTLSRHTLHLGKTFHVASEKYRGELSNTPRPTCGKSG